MNQDELKKALATVRTERDAQKRANRTPKALTPEMVLRKTTPVKKDKLTRGH